MKRFSVLSYPLALAYPQTAMVSARELKVATLDVVVNILYKIIVENRMAFQDVVPHNIRGEHYGYIFRQG